MISGDSWCSKKGFKIGDHHALIDRDSYLNQYRTRKQEILTNFYSKEDRANIRISVIVKYFKRMITKIPMVIRIFFKNTNIVFVETSLYTGSYHGM